ncbi:MAG: hypothetical protein JWO90_1989 [Solirubrobacterales bacterium]|nr:hypothetical protein [Solirubrobacterales bacterium]
MTPPEVVRSRAEAGTGAPQAAEPAAPEPPGAPPSVRGVPDPG